MSTPVRYDQQYCPIARGLDLLGDRWTLLILRELGPGPQRFSDLQRHLPGIAATVLSDRLRSMTDEGLVAVVPADPPGRRHRYSLGPLGMRAQAVLGSLVRFGMPLLETPSPDTVIRPALVVRSTLLAYHDPAAAAGVQARYELHVDDEVFTIDAQGAVVDAAPDPDPDPDGVLTAPARSLVELRQRTADFDELLRRQVISWSGEPATLAQFRSIYRLERAAVARRRAPKLTATDDTVEKL